MKLKREINCLIILHEYLYFYWFDQYNWQSQEEGKKAK